MPIHVLEDSAALTMIALSATSEVGKRLLLLVLDELINYLGMTGLILLKRECVAVIRSWKFKLGMKPEAVAP